MSELLMGVFSLFTQAFERCGVRRQMLQKFIDLRFFDFLFAVDPARLDRSAIRLALPPRPWPHVKSQAEFDADPSTLEPTLDQIQRILRTVVRKKIDAQRLQFFFNCGLVDDLLFCDPTAVDPSAYRAALSSRLPRLRTSFKVDWDRSKSVHELVKDWSHYWNDDVDDHIRSTVFRLKMSGRHNTIALELYCHGRKATTPQIREGMARRGIRPADIGPLLALGIAEPDLQRRISLIALRSSCVDDQGFTCRPALYSTDGIRHIDLVPDEEGSTWLGEACFLGVRK